VSKRTNPTPFLKAILLEKTHARIDDANYADYDQSTTAGPHPSRMIQETKIKRNIEGFSPGLIGCQTFPILRLFSPSRIFLHSKLVSVLISKR